MDKNTEKATGNITELPSSSLVEQVGLFMNYVELVKRYGESLMAEAVAQKAGTKYSRAEEGSATYDRWGTNPGSLRVGEEKVRVRVPRLMNTQTGKTEYPDVYERLREIPLPEEKLMRKVLRGISQKDYESVTREMVTSFGLSQSSISRAFIKRSKELLTAFETRDLGGDAYVALVLDGKHLRREQVVIALGITIEGHKKPLGFIQSTTENSVAVKGLLTGLIKRNFRYETGLLVITDGSRGIIKAVQDVFGSMALMQRCQWHKRENVVSYLPDEDQERYRMKLQRAYALTDYTQAKTELERLRTELEKENHSAANSLTEGMEETLTIHRLGLVDVLGKSLMTTNTIENLNSQVDKYLRKVKRWHDSTMQARWIACAMFEIEARMKRVHNYKKLFLLRDALIRALNISITGVA
jgi:putative transposase